MTHNNNELSIDEEKLLKLVKLSQWHYEKMQKLYKQFEAETSELYYDDFWNMTFDLSPATPKFIQDMLYPKKKRGRR